MPPNVVQVTIPRAARGARSRRASRGCAGNYVKATRRNPTLDPRDYGEGARSLEGFLFPATYELKKASRCAPWSTEQLAAFKRNFAKVDLSYARRKNLTPTTC